MHAKAISVLILLILLSAGFFGFWLISRAPDPRIPIGGNSFHVVFFQNGRPERTGTLTPQSPGAVAVCSLIEKKRGTWRRSFANYAPAIHLESNNFMINIQHNMLIYGTRGDLRGASISPLAPEEYTHVKKIILDDFKETNVSQ